MSAPAPLHDLVGEPLGIRLLRVEELRHGANSPLTDPAFNGQLERTSTAEEREATGDRLRGWRRAS